MASDREASPVGRVVRNPAVQTLAAMVVVSLLTWWSFLVGLTGLFVLAPPVLDPPWGVVTSVYAHANPAHLLSNAMIIAVAGGIVSLSTTRLKFHAFFLSTGALAAVAQVWSGVVLGNPTAVLGSSGAAFALVGYVLASNPVSTSFLDRFRLPARAVVVLVALIAFVLTLTYSAPGSALVAHFTGAVAGLTAGRFRLLRDTRR